MECMIWKQLFEEQRISVKFCFKLCKSTLEIQETKLGFSVRMQKPNGSAVRREVPCLHVQGKQRKLCLTEEMCWWPFLTKRAVCSFWQNGQQALPQSYFARSENASSRQC